MLQKSEDIERNNQRLSIEGQRIQSPNKTKAQYKQTSKTKTKNNKTKRQSTIHKT